MTNDEFGKNPGIVAISRSDYDGWPIGMVLDYVGPFENYDAYTEWRKSKNLGWTTGLHFSWHDLVSPEDYSG